MSGLVATGITNSLPGKVPTNEGVYFLAKLHTQSPSFHVMLFYYSKSEQYEQYVFVMKENGERIKIILQRKDTTLTIINARLTPFRDYSLMEVICYYLIYLLLIGLSLL